MIKYLVCFIFCSHKPMTPLGNFPANNSIPWHKFIKYAPKVNPNLHGYNVSKTQVQPESNLDPTTRKRMKKVQRWEVGLWVKLKQEVHQRELRKISATLWKQKQTQLSVARYDALHLETQIKMYQRSIFIGLSQSRKLPQSTSSRKSHFSTCTFKDVALDLHNNSP